MTQPPLVADTGSPHGALEGQIMAAVESYRDARYAETGEVAAWMPRNVSADAAILKDAGKIRARARDLVRNDPFAKNAVRMNRDAVSGSGLKLALKIDWRTLGLQSIEAAADWQDHVTREWEAFAESVEFQADARRQRTFSQLFSLTDQTDYVDGESISIVEMKPGVGLYQTCINPVDVDRLSNPTGAVGSDRMRGGIERDLYGEPLAYHIRDGHPADWALSAASMTHSRVPRMTNWGRPIVLHTFDHTRPEMTRGVSEFSSAIISMRMLQDYNDTELQSATARAAYAAVIKTELDWSSAMAVLGAQVTRSGGATGTNPLMGMVTAHLSNAADYYRDRGITWRGTKIPHLMPNESLEVIRSESANANFGEFEKAFLRRFAAGLGVEAHELSKNYADVNYSAARAALLSVWRTYRARRTRLITQFAMPFFGAWLEEAFAVGTVVMPKGVAAEFLAVKPYLVRGTFYAWGKPMIDPEKERSAQQLGLTMGTDTLEDVCADDGSSWRDKLEQRAYERTYMMSLGLDPDGPMGPDMPGAPVVPGAAAGETDDDDEA
jgi:lambda family phage portal protein